MSTIVKEKIEHHAVIVDTNILFDQDKSNVVNPVFDEFWNEHAEEANLGLYLPDVVIGELLFQQTSSALKTLSRANDSFDRLSSFTGKAYSHRVNEGRVKKEIRSRLYTWANSKKFIELVTPVEEINWKSMVDSAIWRKAPFSYDPKKEDQEKGFRDALILETVVDYCNSEIERKIVFITNDQLLRETTEERLKHDDTFSAFESLDDFEAYLRLEKESLEQSFIKSVVSKAAKKFFKYQDENSLVYKIDLTGMLNEKYSDKFKNPQVLIPDDFEEGFYSDGEWRPVSRALYSIYGKPQFQKIVGENTFIWLSKILYNLDYEGESESDNSKYIFTHEIYFDVYWRTNISVNERFTKMEFINVEYVKSGFEPKDD